MKDVKVISYIIPGKGRSENFKGTGGGTTIINNTTTSGGGNSGASTDSVKYAEEARTAKYAEEAGKAAIAERAKAADAATEAAHAQTADVAETAGEATKAKHADVAVNAQRADSADHANLANEAVHAQTADRVGEADHAKTADLATLAKNLTADSTDWQKIDGKIEESEKRAEKKFISKLHDDVAKGKIRFEDFITLVRGMWLGDAKIVRAIQSGAAVEADDTAIMTVAKMIGTFLRKDTEDETRYLLKLLGGAIFAYLKTPDWTAGGMLGTGIGAYQDASGMWVIETDKLLVRVKAIFEELEIRRLSYVGGNLLLSGAGSVITAVEDTGTAYRCSIKNDDGTTATMNYWRAGDQARCQTFNIKAGVYQNVQNRFWWRLVTEVGEDYIDVSKSDYAVDSDAPAVGDHVVQLGNRTDVERQAAIMLSAVGSDAPAITQYAGINGYRLTGKQKTRISPHGNIFTGDFYLNDGRSLLQVIDGKITSVISETVRTATDKDNYLTNGSFATGLDGWQGASGTRYFKVGAKYVWANKSPLANKLGAGCSWTTDSGHPVARIAASQLVQLQADYAKRPEIKLLNNKKQAVPVYLSLYVKVLEAGTLTISIASEVTTNFDTFTPLSYSEALTADGEYLHVEATGYWSGTGNLTIATDGVMLIHDVMFTLNEYTYYESRIEQTAQHILLEVQRVENKADSNTTRIGALEVTAESITARVSAVETTAAGNATAIGQLQVRATAIEASVTAVDEKADGIATRVGTLEVTAQSITARVTAVEETAAGNSTAIAALQVRATAIEASVTAVDTKADGIATRVGTLEVTATSITSRVSTVETNLSGVTTRVGTLEVTAENITASIEEIEETVDGNTTAITALQVRAGTIESNLSAVTTTANGNSTAISTLRQTVSEIAATVSSHSESISGVEDDVAELALSVTGIATRVSAVETTASSNSSSISTLQQTVSGISATVSSHTSQISQMGNDLDTANGNIVSVTSRVADLELSASGFSTSISALQTTTGTHTSQISGLQQTANGISTRVTNIENNYATGTALTQTSNSITARVNNVLENQGGRNLLTSSLINETSTLYGFAKRYVRLTAGQKYTLSANGIVPYNAYANDMVLRVYIFRYADQSDVNNGLASNVGDWCNNSNSFAISYNSGNSQTKYVTFTADKTATFVIESYMFHNTGAAYGGTRSYGVTTNWYKLEKGDTATAWQAGIDDQVIWKNYITNPLATDATIGQDVTSHSIITDDRFGRVRKIEASANGNWQMTFTAGNNYDELVGKVATFFIICKRYGGHYSAVEAKTEQLVFGGGDENVNVIHTNNCEFRDLGDGWRLYYSSRQIKTGLMANSQGVDTGTIGVNTLKGTWLIYAAGVVQGGVCPAVADIMEACGLLATGIDITNKKVVITADNFTVQTNSGQKALVAADGKVNIQLLDAVQIVANGIKAQTIDVENANFQNMTISGKSVFKGSVQNPFSVIDSYSVDYNDNVVVLSSGSGGWNGSYSYSLPWTIAQSGRLIRMVNYRWGSSYATGYATLSAPSGKYFFEDGAKKSSIKISREVIELLGYGTASEFYGWIVIKRIDIDTVHKYGRHPRVLAMGRVSGSSMSYKSFDGSTLTATNLGTGLYKVSIPSAWNVEAGELIVMATALYDIGNSTNDNPCYAGVHNIEAENGVVTSFTLQCGDDDSRNDGTIQFMVFNKMDWYYM